MKLPIKIGLGLIKMRHNKKGWIRIVEAFIAILLIAGVLLFVINKGYIGKKDISEQVYQVQLAVLREIELNSNLRARILDVNHGGDAPKDVMDIIKLRMPSYLDCKGRVCNLSLACSIPEGSPIEKDIYSQAVAISAEGERYGPRQLKLFCWTAE